MAEALLKAWGAPATVAAVEIDAAAKHVVRAENTTVTDFKAGSRVVWTEKDGALPLPVNLNDKVLALAVDSSDFTEALDQEPLRVVGLTAALYALKIDGERIGDFTKQELAQGINLALEPTPMIKQAWGVCDLIDKHNDLHFKRRLLEMKQDDKIGSTPMTVDSLDRMEEDVVRQLRAAAQPQPRHYELNPH
jgi:hypothetical protein